MSQHLTGYKTEGENINTPPDNQFNIFQDSETGNLRVKSEDSPDNITILDSSLTGTVNLSGGAASIDYPNAKSTDLLFTSIVNKLGVAPGHVTWTVVPNVGFTLASTNGSDTHTIAYLIVPKD